MRSVHDTLRRTPTTPGVLMCLLLIGCGATDAFLDAGDSSIPMRDDAGTTPPDAGIDAGVKPDSGTPEDAGVIDAGDPDDAGSPDAGQIEESLTLTVRANPNNVISAIATIAWTGPLTNVLVTYEAASVPAASTPPSSLLEKPGRLDLPVLALKQNTIYTMQAVAQDTDGDTTMSLPVQFTTGHLPEGVPSFVVSAARSTSGYTMVARQPWRTGPQNYVSIVDTNGEPVWYYDATPGLGGEFQQQPDGTITLAIADPAQTIRDLPDETVVHRQVDALGNLVHVWQAVDMPLPGPGIHVVATNDHELRILPNGDALLFGFVERSMDMTAYGGRPFALVVGDVLERVTPDGQAVFAWNSFQHLDVAHIDPVATSVSAPVVDFTHANAIDITHDGNYLISLRNLSQVIKINSGTGRVLWKLGGADSDFTFVGDPLGRFSCQHGARELPNGNIILFDDGNGHTPKVSRGVEYALDMRSMTATLVWAAGAQPPLYTGILGFAQRLANGNTLVSFGTQRRAQEIDSLGNVVWDLWDPTAAFGFYRALRIDSLYPP